MVLVVDKRFVDGMCIGRAVLGLLSECECPLCNPCMSGVVFAMGEMGLSPLVCIGVAEVKLFSRLE